LENGDFDEIRDHAEKSIAESGWSFWAASVKLAALYASGDRSNAEAYSAQLQQVGARRVSGLLARIATDRSDSSIPFSSFEARCKEFFSRLDDPQSLALYRARALGIVEENEDYSRLLAADVVSSYIDYYETLVEISISEAADDEGGGELFESLRVFW